VRLRGGVRASPDARRHPQAEHLRQVGHPHGVGGLPSNCGSLSSRCKISSSARTTGDPPLMPWRGMTIPVPPTCVIDHRTTGPSRDAGRRGRVGRPGPGGRRLGPGGSPSQRLRATFQHQLATAHTAPVPRGLPGAAPFATNGPFDVAMRHWRAAGPRCGMGAARLCLLKEDHDEHDGLEGPAEELVALA
jgi:hypothetical protein